MSLSSGDSCFAEVNRQHGVEFVSPLYLSQLEYLADQQQQHQAAVDASNSSNDGGKEQEKSNRRIISGALFLDKPTSSFGQVPEPGTVIASTIKPRRGRIQWAVERAIAMPRNADASRWLSDINRCAIRLDRSLGRSVLPRLNSAISHRPLAIVPMSRADQEEHQQQQKQQQDNDQEAGSNGFEYLILRESVPAPSSQRVKKFFDDLPSSSVQHRESQQNQHPTEVVKRVSLQDDGDAALEKRSSSSSVGKSAAALLSGKLAEDFEKSTTVESKGSAKSRDHQQQQHHNSDQHHDHAHDSFHNVHLSLSSPTALFAPRNHNEGPVNYVRSWLSTRLSLSTAPFYSFLGGASLNVDRLQFEAESTTATAAAATASSKRNQKDNKDNDGDDHLVSAGMEQAFLNQNDLDDAQRKADEQDRREEQQKLQQQPRWPATPPPASSRKSSSAATGSLSEFFSFDDNTDGSSDLALIDPFDQRSFIQAPIDLPGEHADDNDAAEDSSSSTSNTNNSSKRFKPPSVEHLNLHQRIQSDLDRRFDRDLHRQYAARSRVIDKLALSPEYAHCFDLLQDRDIDTANRNPVHGKHRVNAEDELNLFSLSGVLGKGGLLNRQSAAERLLSLFGLSRESSSTGLVEDDFFAELVTAAVLRPLGSAFRMLHSTVYAHPIGRDQTEVFAAGHAVVASAAQRREQEQQTQLKMNVTSTASTPSTTALRLLSRLFPSPWLIDVYATKTRDAPHFLTAEIDAYTSARCEFTFAEAPLWTFFGAWKDRSVSQLPIATYQQHAHDADAASNSAVSPSPRMKSHQRSMMTTAAAAVTATATPTKREQDGQSVARDILMSTPNAATNRGGGGGMLPPLSPQQQQQQPPPTPVAAATPAAAASTPLRNSNFEGSFRGTPNANANAAAAAAAAANIFTPTRQQQAAHTLPVASSAFSPMSYTSRITAPTRRHYDGQFLTSPRGIAHQQQFVASKQKQKPSHVADGRTVELGANYNYRWCRSWEVPEIEDDEENNNSIQNREEADDNKPLPAFWDNIEFRGAFSLLYGIAKRAVSEQELYERELVDLPVSRKQQQPGDGVNSPAFILSSPRRATLRERDIHRTYLGESAVPLGDGTTRFYSIFNTSASWIAEKMLGASSLLRLRGGFRWALASDASAVPTLDEKNREEDGRLMRGSPFLNHFFSSGSSSSRNNKSAGENNSISNNSSGDAISNAVFSNSCIHQPQGAFALEFETNGILPVGAKANLFLGGTGSCHLLSGSDYLAAINAEVMRGPSYFSSLFGAPMTVAPSVARAAESRARSRMMQTNTSGAGFSLATNVRALAEIVAGVSLSFPLTGGSGSNEFGEIPVDARNLGRRLEFSWWLPLWSLDTMQLQTSQQLQQQQQPDRAASGFWSNWENRRLHRFGISLHL